MDFHFVRKYSVVRLPKGVAIQTPAIDTLSRQWMQNTWRHEDIFQEFVSPAGSFGRGKAVAYFSNSINNTVLTTLASAASEVFIAELRTSDIIRYTKVYLANLAGVISPLAASDTRLLEELEEKNRSMMRLVPVLLPKDEERSSPTKPTDGLAVVIGMGSIRHAIAGYLGSSGCTTVVFMGRRTGDDAEASITQGLQSLRSSHHSTTMKYVQGDVTDMANLHLSIDAIANRFGEVKHVVYTAGVIRDATISTVSNDNFASVLDSKALGAWNMHLISQEMKWNMKCIHSAQQHKNAEKVAQNPGFASDAIIRELRLNNASKGRVVKKMYLKKELLNITIRIVKDVLEVGQNDPFHAEKCAGEAGC
ncbi:KR domain-containing protein [Cyathus striatus]|nr:KR domain-containing protein [Cyathus striatus]